MRGCWWCYIGYLSSCFRCPPGICTQATILFLIYIDDISRVSISSGSLTVYADDLVLYRTVCSSSDFRLLQQDIDNISSWTSVNHLMLNSTKCKYMVISRKRQPPTPTDPLLVNHSQLEKVTTLKYIGVWISSDLSWSTHVSKVCKNTRRLIGLLYRCFYCYSSPDTLKQLYIQATFGRTWNMLCLLGIHISDHMFMVWKHYRNLR